MEDCDCTAAAGVGDCYRVLIDVETERVFESRGHVTHVRVLVRVGARATRILLSEPSHTRIIVTSAVEEQTGLTHFSPGVRERMRSRAGGSRLVAPSIED